MYKYPRTDHIQGSRFQPGDEDLLNVPFKEIVDRNVIIEEKVDGANVGISFSSSGELLLQSRGHYLTGGAREKHFNLFKQWANCLYNDLWEVLSTRYILYGEWMYAKHTVFYDYLPHYFLEFDILDLETEQFLSTCKRQELLAALPIKSVPVLYSGKLKSQKQLTQFLKQSNYITSEQITKLREIATKLAIDVDKTLQQTDRSSRMEGLYIKVEEDNIVKARYKYVRASFLTAISQSDGHWLDRPIVPNQLQPDVDLFAF